MSNFQDRFNELMQRTGADASTLAVNLGVSKQTISAWKTGVRSPKQPVLKVVAEYFDVSPAWLCGLDVPMGSYKEFSGIIPLSRLQTHKIPLLGSVAAGEPIYDAEFPDVVVDGPFDADCAYKVKGDSMEPSYIDGDLVYIKSMPELPHDGALCVVAIDDDAALKHVYKQQDAILLTSINPAYGPMLYSYADHVIRILGVPVGYTRIFKRQK